jgi:hypothetical protein
MILLIVFEISAGSSVVFVLARTQTDGYAINQELALSLQKGGDFMFNQPLVHGALARHTILFAGLLCLAIISSACSGQTNSTGTPACNKTFACYGVVSWNIGNTTLKLKGAPQGILTHMYVRDITCDSTCQSQNGFAENYILVSNSGQNQWYKVGISEHNYDSLYYFMADDDPYGLHMADVADATNNSSATSDRYNYVWLGLQLDISTKPADWWAEVIRSDNSQGYAGWINYITPAAAQAGLLIYGTQGIAAEDSDWLSLRYMTTPDTKGPQQISTTLFPYLLTDAGEPAPYQTSPPYAQWLHVYIDGDTFTAQCCVP